MRYSILVVDDEPATCHMLRTMLEPEGYRVSEAYDGRNALRVIEDGLRPHAVIMDIMMPLLDGIGLARAIRQRDDIGGVPIILFSAKTRITALRDGIDAGADRFISKPIERSKLLSMLSDLLAEKYEKS